MKDNFYSISDLERSEGSCQCVLHFNDSHPVFEGHFPGNPIVPGVCTIAIVKDFLSETTGKKLMLHEAKTIKFLGLINPSMTPRLSVFWKEDERGLSVTAALQGDTSPLFKMSADYLAG